MMGVRCDAPGCEAFFQTRVGIVPDGWWYSTSTIRGTHACPLHADEAKGAEKALHKWEEKRVRAINAWMKKNPPPPVADWLEDIVP
jgi:hypothetical protein